MNKKLASLKGIILKNRLRVLVLVIILALGGYFGVRHFTSATSAPQYQTAQAQKGTLVTSITGSGTISSGSSVAITTQAGGVVSGVYVKNGDTVTQGEKIADLSLDLDSQQKLASAWSNYLQAKNSLDSANNQLNTLQDTEFTANQKLINDAVARGLSSSDPTYIEENAAWLAAEESYKNQQQVIAQAQAQLTSAWLSYEQISSTITAPSSGVISGLNLTPGSAVSGSSSQSTSSTGTASSTQQTLGTITVNGGELQASVNISEIDAPKVSPGQKATLTLDAFPGKTFTGRILAINSAGVVSSGVTSYPVTIILDNSDPHIYPNMATTATIITKVDNNVLLIPSSALQTQGGQSTVRVLKNGQVGAVPVQTGDSNDTEAEVTSGLNEGDQVVTSIITPQSGNKASGQSGTSPFGGGFGGARGFGGGARGGGRGG